MNRFYTLKAVGALFCVFLVTMSTTESFAAKRIDLRHEPFELFETFSQSSQSISWKTVDDALDFNGAHHVHLQQTFQGYPVWGADAMIHQQSDHQKKFMNGVVYQEIESDLMSTPVYALSDTQIQKAEQEVMQWYHGHSTSFRIPKLETQRIVYMDTAQTAHWAFLISLFQQESFKLPIKQTFIIDAVTLKPYRSWSDVQTLQETMSGGFGGNSKLGKIVYDGLKQDYPFFHIERDAKDRMCYLENKDVIVRDARHEGDIENFLCDKKDKQHNNIYWDADHDAINGAFSPGNDALYIGQIIKNMYQEWYGIPVLLGDHKKSLLLNMIVHAKMDNACWDGAEMIFGDGDNEFYPLVSLGVAAHEISHGFTGQHSRLNYDGQSGGLNESFSDMAAAAAEFYAYKTNQWQIGPEVLKIKNKPLRYMDEPTKDCEGRKPGDLCSISHTRDYVDGIDVHFSSGVFNKLFYLLSTTKDWDTKKAFDVMVQANRYYWTPNTNFTEAACGVLQATKDYHYSIAPVQRAAREVGIDLSTC